MASHRARAQFDRAKWHLSLLLPVWALQLTLAMTTMGIFAWRLVESFQRLHLTIGEKPTAVKFAQEVANLTLSLMAACCTFLEMARFVAESLTPAVMLHTHVIKLVCSITVLALDIYAYLAFNEAIFSIVSLGLDAAAMITVLLMSGYVTVTYRRLAAYDDYARPVNFKGYGFHDFDDGEDGSQRPASNRSSRPPSVPGGGGGGGRYTLQRDTQFDEYVARRSPRRIGSDVPDILARHAAEALLASPPGAARPRVSSFAASDRWSRTVSEDKTKKNHLNAERLSASPSDSYTSQHLDKETGEDGEAAPLVPLSETHKAGASGDSGLAVMKRPRST